ncbi:MAG: transcriptional regulator NrdR [Candidatus Desulfofervidaceae bacterium]|nr:transcriptional regulator NrdR [Candidatus Desulfofervidaceae bacterium]
MKCPFCGSLENRVIDSRLSKDATAIRRRRECLECGRRFTTYEYVEEIQLMVVKKDGRREPFNRQKILQGIKLACQKRPISINQMEEFVRELEQSYQETGIREIPTSDIGEKVMAKLHEWDKVAYVRFASVYRDFKDVTEFMRELEKILAHKKEQNE